MKHKKSNKIQKNGEENHNIAYRYYVYDRHSLSQRESS